MSKKGRIFVTATPIGNMKDITLRAIEVLKDVDYILSEDTRETKKILERYEINKEQISYRDQNHNRVKDNIFELLDAGNDLALVSDSGTPLISDPGFKLIEEASEKGYQIIAIPGASAVVSALSISGLPTDKFTFLGFLPKGKGQISKILSQYGELDSTLVIYESPFRVSTLIKIIEETLGNRFICVCNEMTKMFEEVTRGYAEELTNQKFKEKGEYVVLVAKKDFRSND